MKTHKGAKMKKDGADRISCYLPGKLRQRQFIVEYCIS